MAATDKEFFTYLELGTDIGSYIVASLVAEGYSLTPRGAEIMMRHTSDEISRLSGMPAEDFMLMMDKIIDAMKQKVKEANGE